MAGRGEFGHSEVSGRRASDDRQRLRVSGSRAGVGLLQAGGLVLVLEAGVQDEQRGGHGGTVDDGPAKGENYRMALIQ